MFSGSIFITQEECSGNVPLTLIFSSKFNLTFPERSQNLNLFAGNVSVALHNVTILLLLEKVIRLN